MQRSDGSGPNNGTFGLPEYGQNSDGMDLSDVSNHDMYQPFNAERDPQLVNFFTNDESWDMQLGPLTFNLPPQTVHISRSYSNAAAAYVLRSKTASKLSPGRYTRVIEMSLLFSDLEDVWQSTNSLRKLIALYKTTPFLPVRNAYLNSIFNIDAISLVSLSINTVPGLPGTISASLICYEFNWKAYVPVEGTFWDVFDEPRFQKHLELSSKMLDSYSSMPFKMDRTGLDHTLWNAKVPKTDVSSKAEASLWEQELETRFGPRRTVKDVSDFELYYSDKDYSSEMWLNKINTYKQVVDYGDESMSDPGQWFTIVKNSVFESLLLSYLGEGEPLTDIAVQNITEQFSDEEESKKSYEAFTAICSLAEYYIGSDSKKAANYTIAYNKILEANPSVSPETAKRMAYFSVGLSLQKTILADDRIQAAITDSKLRWLPEWELPMRRFGLLNHDLRESMIIEGVSVSTQNAIMSLPLSGKTTPVHQHLGSLGTNATVSMKVFGERALRYLNNVLDQIDLSALRNKESGVTGFLGIENDLINVMGMRYALVDGVTVDTIPGLPHVYQVSINLSDFDILQQKREQPTVFERLGMATQMTNGHPIMRAKQMLSKMNAYPDMPLPRLTSTKTYFRPLTRFDEGTKQYVTDKELVELVTRKVRDQYYDPDYYFKQAIYYDNVAGTDETKDIDGAMVGGAGIPDMDVIQSPNDKISRAKVTRAKDATGINTSVEIIDDPGDIATGYEGVNVKMKVENAFRDGMSVAQIITYLNSEEGKTLSAEEAKPWVSRMINGYLSQNEAKNIEDAIEDMRYRSIEGRMIKAFPTCVVYLIDEGDNVMMYKLYDTFYGMQSLISAQVMLDKEAPLDSAVLQFSNIYNKLSTPQWYESYTLPQFVYETVSTAANLAQRVGGMVTDLDHIKVETGMRVQVRFGYSANPEALPIVFNGTITEVADGPVLTVVAQGDGAELGVVSAANFSAKSSTSGFHDWLRGRAFVEPQDLIIKYLAAYGGAWQEFTKRATAGMSNPGDISSAAHFGACLWDTTIYGGDDAFRKRQAQAIQRARVHLERAAKRVSRHSVAGGVVDMMGLGINSADEFIAQGIENFSKLVPDFELYKRNIYPANMTGIRDFGPPPSVKHEIFKQFVHGVIDAAYSPADDPEQDTDDGATDEYVAHFNTGGKTNWEIMKMCEAMMPNYVLAVRPFEHRSTLFYGKQGWLYTSGVLPVFDGTNLPELRVGKPTPLDIVDSIDNSGDRQPDAKYNAVDADYGRTAAIAYPQYWPDFVKKWLAEPEVVKEIFTRSKTTNDETETGSLYGDFLKMSLEEPIVGDFLTIFVGAARCLYLNISKEAQAKVDEDAKYYGKNTHVMRSRHGNAKNAPSQADLGPIIDDSNKGLSPLIKPEKFWNVIISFVDDYAEGVKKGTERFDKLSDDKKKNGATLDGLIKIESRKLWAKSLLSAMGVMKSMSTIEIFYDINTDKFFEELEQLSQGAKTGYTNEATGGDGTLAKKKDEPAMKDDIKLALADIMLVKAGGVESLLSMSGMLEAQAIAQWGYLNDTTYYGINADGSESDPFPGREFFGGIDTKTGKQLYKAGIPPEIKLARELMISADNPFSKEFGEPVFEVREMFSRFHSITSETNLVANTLFEDETNVANVIRAFAHKGSGNDGKKEITVRADRSIPPNYVREKVYDTGYNYDMANIYDQVNHRSMALYALKRSLQQMYGGELVILGDGHIRPFDYIWMWDTPNQMRGNCEVERVTHHFGLDTGYITAVKVAPIIAVDDTFAFSVWDYIMHISNRDHALRYIANERAGGFQNTNILDANKAAGFTNDTQQTAEKERENRSVLARKTLGIASGNVSDFKTYGIGSMISQFIGDGPLIEDKDKDAEKKKKARKNLKTEDTVQSYLHYGYLAVMLFAAGAFLFTFGVALVPLLILIAGSATGIATMALTDHLIDMTQVQRYGKILGNDVVRAQENGELLKSTVFSSLIMACGISPMVGAVLVFFGAKGLFNGLTYLIEEEPIKVIPLMKGKDTFQAGLKGARGIINGQASTIPLFSDLTGIGFEPEDENSTWNEFGYTLKNGSMLSRARSYAEYRMASRLMATNARAEDMLDDDVAGRRIVFTAKVLEVIDGDTIAIPVTALPSDADLESWRSRLKTNVKSGKPNSIHIRLKYVDAPETKKDSKYGDTKKAEFAGEAVKNWLKKKIPVGSTITLVASRIGHSDDYGRLLAFIVAGDHVDDLKEGPFNWLDETINGDMVNPMANEQISIEYDGGLKQAPISDYVMPLFTIPYIDNINTRA
jgi:endonuclease YncB( thermonuclease family)